MRTGKKVTQGYEYGKVKRTTIMKIIQFRESNFLNFIYSFKFFVALADLVFVGGGVSCAKYRQAIYFNYFTIVEIFPI